MLRMTVLLDSLGRLGEFVLLWLSLRLAAGEGLIATLLKLCTFPASLCWFNCCWWCCALLSMSLSFRSVSFSKDSPESGQTDARYWASNACSPTRNCLPRPWEYSHSAFKLNKCCCQSVPIVQNQLIKFLYNIIYIRIYTFEEPTFQEDQLHNHQLILSSYTN